MYIKKDYENLWMSPNVAISRLYLLVNKYGIEEVIKRNAFKREREAWIAASFLLGLRETDQKEYWIEIATKESTPDIYAYSLKIVDGNFHRDVYNIEIAEWEEHGKSLLEIIKNKCKKNYPKFFWLLIYARKPGTVIDYDILFKEIDSFSDKIPFSSIWILANSSDNNDYHLTEVCKIKRQIGFNLDQALIKNKRQNNFATFTKRNTGTEIKHLGDVYVPLPKL